MLLGTQDFCFESAQSLREGTQWKPVESRTTRTTWLKGSVLRMLIYAEHECNKNNKVVELSLGNKEL